MFIKQLLQKLTNPQASSSEVLESRSPLIVGIDPQLSLIHPSLLTNRFSKIFELSNFTKPNHSLEGDGNLLGIIADLYLHYAKVVIDAVYDLVPAIKIQVAFFEPYGQYGMVALHEVICYAQEKGLLVISDAKRGDISSTAEAYAKTFLGNLGNSEKIIKSTISPLSSDALTVNPYMGADSLEPFFLRTRIEKGLEEFDEANEAHRTKGVFVLLKTSNPGSIDIQDQELKDGSKVYDLVIKMIKAEIDSHHFSYMQNSNSEYSNYSNVGVVVGATFPEEAKRIRILLPYSYFLVPGLGFQQGNFSELRNYLNPDGKGALFNVSRGIIYPHLLKDNLDSVGIRSSYTWKQLGEDVRNLTKHYAKKIKAAIE